MMYLVCFLIKLRILLSTKHMKILFWVMIILLNYIQVILQINKIDIYVWHKRLSHPCEKTMKYMFKTLNLNFYMYDLSFYENCHFGKHKHSHFLISNIRVSKFLELVHSNLWGPTSIISREGFKYCLHFLDVYTKFI